MTQRYCYADEQGGSTMLCAHDEIKKKNTKFNFKFALDQILEFYFLNGDTVGQKLQKVVVDRNILSCSFEFPTALDNHT